MPATMTVFGNTFNTNCTLPTTPYHYVTSANFRSTTDIFWSSWASLILFTWTIQHLNVPVQKELRTWKQKCRNLIEETLLKVLFMLGTMMAPEMLIGKAMVDWISARTSKEEMEEFAKQDKVEWGVTHGFYTNMGGFVIEFSHDTQLPPTYQTPQHHESTMESTTHLEDDISSLPMAIILRDPNSIKKEADLEHVSSWKGTPKESELPRESMPGKRCPCRKYRSSSEYTYMSIEDIVAHTVPSFWNGSFKISPWKFRYCIEHPNDESTSMLGTINNGIASEALYCYAHQKTYTTRFPFFENGLNRLRGRFWALDARQLYIARQCGIIATLPSVSEVSLNDQSKGDAIIKLSAIFQVYYLVLQLILRYIERLPSTLLEIMVVSFSACASMTYALYFSKPQSVGVPRYIQATRYPTPEEMCEIASAAPFGLVYPYPKMTYAITNLSFHHCKKTFLSYWIAGEGSTLAGKMFVVGSVFGSAIFGGIHCIAWFLEFPTQIEQKLWRVSCLCTVFVSVPTLFGIASPPMLLVRKIKRFFVKYFENRKPKGSCLRFARGDITWGLTWGVFITLGSLAYVLARLFVICEVFRQLFFLPPAAFQTTSWLISFPHIN